MWECYGCGGGASGIDSAEGTNVFLHMEDMELMLHRACRSLLVGALVFEPVITKGSNGSMIYEFMVFLLRNERGLEIGVYGPHSMNERVARQEASFLLMKKVVEAPIMGIYDYNHRSFGRQQQNARAHVNDVGEAPTEDH
ncbi:hypothetical protein PIB30_072987 [Stylosanthes scabra]|uniref:Uncharacterized protein n=1 Tax=Stylosanthes scabra TaxID=79078 RepID=A0ABU6WMH9_9FABA|nr:hypothetical protein [Stylosanthes scabra]